MTVTFKVRSELITHIRADLHRAHAFAAERVGFISCRAAHTEDGGLVVLAEAYHPVADDGYVDDARFGALIGTSAIRSALQVSMTRGVSMFHVHAHAHRGHPEFSKIDVRENAKFLPDFFNVSPTMPHGAIVISDDGATGTYWSAARAAPSYINRIIIVGAPLQIHERTR